MATPAFAAALASAILNAFVVPATIAASTSAQPADPTTPSYTDDVTWLTAYLTIHSLSKNSYVYMYILWFVVALVFLALSCATWSGVRVSALGARWTKWALRRRTWRKKHTLREAEADARRRGVPVSAVHRQPRALPSNAQILSAAALVVVVLLLCFVGPDYINPDLNLFNFSSSSTSTSTSTTKRATQINDATLAGYIPHYTISKSFWSIAARTGGVAFALYPLVVVLALKAPPFALFAIPGLVAYSHDKMIRLHRYVGRLVWFVTLLHVVFWVVQVLKDRREATGELVIMYVWEYQKFRFAWVAFLSMTILMLFSLDCIRTPHYELFYAAHIVFTPLTLVFSALHHPQHGLWGWCVAALALWAGERLWRACWWVYVNGVFRIGGEHGKKRGVERKRGREAGVGSVRPYTYYMRAGEREAPAAHRSAPSRGSLATLTNPVGSMGAGFDGKKEQEQEQEQWEMDSLPLRAPAPRRPQSELGLGLGSDDEGMDTPSRPASSASTASVYTNTNTNTNTHDGDLTPTPGELIELARVQTGNSASGTSARGVPLQIQTGMGAPTVPVPVPAYRPAAHARHVAAQSPGAGPGPRTSAQRRASLSASSSVIAPHHRFQPQPRSQTARASAYAPPPGFALATLLPGRMVRLRLVTPGYQTWAPGQHFLVGIPAVSRFTTHPFSVASVCDEQADGGDGAGAGVDADAESPGKRIVQAEAGRELVLLVRAKKGWTKRLWDLVSSLQSQGLASPPGESLPSGSTSPPPLPPPGSGTGQTGVVLRALVDGPFGSAGRTRWGRYASVLIVAGGSGVSFGLSVLEYVCLCIAGRDGRFLGGHPGGWGVGKKGAWVTQRVRFVWLVREYAHIQWCVGALRRCLTIVPTDALELNIFVTNFRPPKELLTSPSSALDSVDGHTEVSDDGLLKPPAPRFLRGGDKGGGGSRRASVSSDDSFASDISVDSIVDSYFDVDGGGGGGAGDGEGGELGHETHVLDYTNFDGDDDTPLPGEHRLSRRIIKESKLRRARSRKVEKAVRAKQELEERVAANANAWHAKSPSDEVVSHRLSTLSAEPLLPYASPNAGGVSPISPAASTYSAFSAFSAFDRHARPRSPPPSSFSAFGLPPGAGAGAGANGLSPEAARRLSGASTAKSVSGASTPSLTPTTATPSTSGVRWLDPAPLRGSDSKPGSGSRLALDPQEVRDLQVVSEWARPGKPKLGRVLADEVEASKGRVAVACCGPTSLNALMRKLIAEQISPARVARGDLRGSIDFIAEDFEY